MQIIPRKNGAYVSLATRKRSSAVNSPVNGTPHSVGRSVATEINNHPELPGVQKYGAFPRRIVHEKVNAGLPGKVDQVLRGPLEERGGEIARGNEEGKIGEKDSGTRFGRTLEREISPIYTPKSCSYVLHTCV